LDGLSHLINHPMSERQLAAIMFTDIVGYTALMGKDSDKALELIRISKEIQKPLVEKHNGKWLKEMGDGAMAQFNTALDAVNCSIEIQKSARAELDAKLRIGIHLGDVMVEEDDVHGDGVNVAARLESIADAGGIYISDNIEKAIQGQTDVQAKYLGEVKLKNVAYGVRTYALQGVGLPVPEVKDEKEVSGHFWAEIQRRGVIRAGVAYTVVTLLLILLLREVQNWLTLPELSLPILITALVVGFPLAMYLAWNYERSPEGFVKTTSQQSWQNPYKASQRKPLTSNFIIVGLVVVIIAMYAYSRYLTEGGDLESGIGGNSIAVLYFDNMSGDPEQEYFSDGITEEIITHLSQIDGLSVRSRNSAKVYKEKSKSIEEIARELKVSTILEGSVRKSGNKYRISAQLINAETNEHIWAENYDYESSNILQIQIDIARAIASKFEIEISPEIDLKISKIPTTSVEAYDLYRKGFYFNEKYWNTLQEEDFEKSKRYFEQAIEIDSTYAEAYAGLAEVYDNKRNNTPIKGDFPEELAKLKRRLADKAYQLDPNSAYVNIARSFAFSHRTEPNVDSFFYHLKRALILEHNNTNYVGTMAHFLSQNCGLSANSISFYKKAIELDPINPNTYVELGDAFSIIGKEAEAKIAFQKAIDLEPGRFRREEELAYWLIYYGELQEVERRLKNRSMPVVEAYLLASKGEYNKVEERYKNDFWVLSFTNNKEEIMKALDNFTGSRTAHVYSWALTNKYFNQYRKDPEFQRIFEKANKLHDEYMEKYGDVQLSDFE